MSELVWFGDMGAESRLCQAKPRWRSAISQLEIRWICLRAKVQNIKTAHRVASKLCKVAESRCFPVFASVIDIDLNRAA